MVGSTPFEIPNSEGKKHIVHVSQEPVPQGTLLVAQSDEYPHKTKEFVVKTSSISGNIETVKQSLAKTLVESLPLQ